MRVRSDRGQTAAEYLGIIVVLAAVVLAIASTSPGKTISHGISQAVCRIVHAADGGGSCAAAPDAQASTTGGSRPSGPPIGTGPGLTPGIPWDGSISLSERSNPGDGPYLEATIEKSRSVCRPDAGGSAVVTLDVTGKLQAGVAVSTGGGKNAKGKVTPEVSADAYGGKAITYGISTDPKTADAITSRKRKPPNPVDPRSIPEGTAITLDKSTYTGLNLSASYRGVQASLDYQKGKAVSTAVQRVDANHVQVLVGDSKYIQQAVELGLGTDDFNVSFGHSDTFSDGKAKSVNIDISTAGGRAAYKAFLTSGRLPSQGDSVTNEQSTESSTVSGEGHVGAKLGPVDATLSKRDFKNEVTVTRDASGRAVTTTQYAQTGDQSLTRISAKGGDGFPATSSSTIRLQNADRLERNAFEQLGVIPEGTKGDIAISLTDPQLQALHEKAIEYLAAYASKTEGKPVSTDKIRELLAKGLDVETGLGNERTALLLLAKSNDPTAILNALATANQTGGLGPFLVRLDDQLSRNGRPGIANLDVKATPSSC